MRSRRAHLSPDVADPAGDPTPESEAAADEASVAPETDAPEPEAADEPTDGAADEPADGPTPDEPPPPQRTLVDVLRDQLAEKDAKLHEYIAAYKEAKRDMDDRLSRAKRDREKLIDRDRKQLGGDLIEVLDNLDRSITALADPSAVEGLRMVHKQFGQVLDRFGVERMHALGQTFDARFHEAIGMIPAQPGQEDQEIVHVDRAGYVFKGELLRPARVVVATKA